jgi:hypothetical protein
MAAVGLSQASWTCGALTRLVAICPPRKDMAPLQINRVQDSAAK